MLLGKSLKTMKYNLPKNIKKMAAILTVNGIILGAIYSLIGDKFNAVHISQAQLNKNKNIKDEINALADEFKQFKNQETADNFDLEQQARTFNAFASSFKKISITDFKGGEFNALGRIYGAKGKYNDLLSFAYQVNKIINRGELKARLLKISINNNQAALTVQIYGAINENN